MVAVEKTIKKYAKLRGYGHPELTFQNLLSVFHNSNESARNLFIAEMEQYFEAIKNKKIKKGESILHSVYETNTD